MKYATRCPPSRATSISILRMGPTGNATALLPPQFLRPSDARTSARGQLNRELSFSAGDGQPAVSGVCSLAGRTTSARRAWRLRIPAAVAHDARSPARFYYGILAQVNAQLVDQLHLECPEITTGASAFARWLAASDQFVGERRVGAGVVTTPDNFDFTGGEGGWGTDLGGGLRMCARRQRRPDGRRRDPHRVVQHRRSRGRQAATPATRRNAVQRPGINNWNLAVPKIQGRQRRAFQFRAEIYNVLNTVVHRHRSRGRLRPRPPRTKTTFRTRLASTRRRRRRDHPARRVSASSRPYSMNQYWPCS